MAAGDYLVRRNNANTDEVPDAGSDLLCLWDTLVASNGSGITYSAGKFSLGEVGKFLVMASDQIGTASTTNNERKSSKFFYRLAGSELAVGQGSAFIRQSGGSQEFIPQAIGVVDVASTVGSDDELEVVHERLDDSTTGQPDRVADRSGVSILKLDDSWPYAHYRSDGPFTPSATDDTRNQADLGDTVEEDGTVFEITGNIVKVTTSQPVVVIYTFRVDQADVLSGRTEISGVVDFDGGEFSRSWGQTYGPRATDNADAGAVSVGLLLYPDGTGQDLELMLVSREDTDEDWLADIQMFELPTGTKSATVSRGSQFGNVNVSGAEHVWDSTQHLDTDVFTHDDDTSNIDVDEAGDFLAFASLGAGSGAWASGSQRCVPAISFRVNTTEQPHVGNSTYNRNSGSAEHGHMAIAALLPGLVADDSVSVYANKLGTTTSVRPAMGGFSLISLASLFPAAGDEDKDDTDGSQTTVDSEVGVGIVESDSGAGADVGDGWVDLDGSTDYIERAGAAMGTGVMEFIFRASADDWGVARAAETDLAAQWRTGGFAFRHTLQTNGRFTLRIYSTATHTFFAPGATGIPDGEARWIRVVMDPDIGGSLANCKWWYSDAPADADPSTITWGTEDHSTNIAGPFTPSNDADESILLGARDSVSQLNHWSGTIAYGYGSKDGGTDVFEFDARTTGPDGSDQITDLVDAAEWTVEGSGWTYVTAPAERIEISESDSGSGSESESLDTGATPKAGTDAGSGSFAESIEISESDSGSGSEAESIEIVDTDSGSGSDDSEAIAFTDLDAGVGSESETVGLVDSDSGSGVAAETLAVALVDTEAGSGVEDQTLDTGETKADSDSGSGSAAEDLVADLTSPESGSGFSGEVLAVVAGPDTGSGTDDESLQATDTDTDSGSGSSVQALASTLGDDDSGAGDSSEAITAGAADTDSGTGDDSEALTAVYPDTDSGSGSESETIGLAESDAGSGSEGSEIAADLDSTDSGSGSESESVSTANDKASTDAGTGSESESVTVAVDNADAGVGSSSSSIEATHIDTDAGSGSEDQALDAGTAKADSDAGTGSSVESLALNDTDAGSGSESAAIAQADTDSGTGDDSEALTVSESDSGSGVDTETAPVVAINDTDAGTGSEDETLDAGDAKQSSDAGSGTESESLVVAVEATDQVSGADQETQALTVQLQNLEGGSGDDSADETIGIGTSDEATGTSGEGVVAGAGDTETGTGAESSLLAVVQVDVDTGTGSESEALALPFFWCPDPTDISIDSATHSSDPSTVSVELSTVSPDPADVTPIPGGDCQS